MILLIEYVYKNFENIFKSLSILITVDIIFFYYIFNIKIFSNIKNNGRFYDKQNFIIYKNAWNRKRLYLYRLFQRKFYR